MLKQILDITNMKQDQNKPREECSCYCHYYGLSAKQSYASSCLHCTDMNKTKEIEEKPYYLTFENREELFKTLRSVPDGMLCLVGYVDDKRDVQPLSLNDIKQELIAEIKKRISKLTIYRIDTGREYIHLGHLKRILSEL